jgi:hypothetical protein
MLEGNHEHRIARATSTSAKLHGKLSLSDLQFDYFGWEVVPYDGATPGVLNLDGIAYAHFHVSGVMCRPISGVRPAYNMIQKYGRSMTAGHSHILDFYHRSNTLGNAYGLVCGVFQDYRADFAGVANDMWWRGMVHKHEVENGTYDPEFISLSTLKRNFKRKK